MENQKLPRMFNTRIISRFNTRHLSIEILYSCVYTQLIIIKQNSKKVNYVVLFQRCLLLLLLLHSEEY